MRTRLTLLWFSPCLALAVLSPGVISAQPEPAGPVQGTDRNADTWNGMRHQPTQDAIRERERQNGIAEPGKRQQAETRTLDQIGRQLLDKGR